MCEAAMKQMIEAMLADLARNGTQMDGLELADLEEARRAGRISESEYRRRRETRLVGDRY